MRLRLGFLALAMTSAAAALAQVPLAFTFQVNVRAGAGGQLQSNAINSATVSINNAGDVAVKAIASSTFGVWRGNPSGGTFIDAGIDSGMGDAYIQHDGSVLFASSDTPPGIYRVAPGGSSASLFTNGPAGASSWSNPRLTNSGLVGYRTNASSSLGQLVLFDPATNNYTTVASAGGGISFLYSAAKLNANGVFGTKVDLASNAQQEMRRYRPDGSFDILAQNQGVNAGSQFVNFFNNVGWGDNNALAFNANLGSGNRGIFWSDGTTTRLIASSTTSDARPTESFDMGVLGNLVYFRAFDLAGKRALWVGDGTNLTRIVTEGDVITTPQGTFRIASGFHGSPTINSLGQVAFAVNVLDPSSGASMGVAALTASPVPEPATLAALGVGVVALLRRRRK